MNLLVQRLDPELPLPQYAHPGDAGLDLHSRVDVTLAAGGAVLGADRLGDRAAGGVRGLRAPA